MQPNSKNPAIPPNGWRCSFHSQHVEKIDHIEKYLDKHDTVHKEQMSCLREKTPSRLFYLLISILVIVMGSMLTFQWKNYERLGRLEIKVTEEIAILKTKLDSHMQFTNQYKNSIKNNPK